MNREREKNPLLLHPRPRHTPLLLLERLVRVDLSKVAGNLLAGSEPDIGELVHVLDDTLERLETTGTTDPAGVKSARDLIAEAEEVSGKKWRRKERGRDERSRGACP
jgi:hypothetical protein